MRSAFSLIAFSIPDHGNLSELNPNLSAERLRPSANTSGRFDLDDIMEGTVRTQEDAALFHSLDCISRFHCRQAQAFVDRERVRY